MFSLLWQLIKSIKYILPFIDEVTNKTEPNNYEDRLKIESLKKYMRSAVWRIAYAAVFCYTVFNVAIPLYTRNHVLEQELSNREQSLKEAIARNDRNESIIQDLSQTSATQQARILSKDEELRRLVNALGECHDVEMEYRNYLFTHQISSNPNNQAKSTPTSKTKTTSKQGGDVPSVKPTTSELSETTKKRLSSMNQ